jgi:hypothetical protein
VAWQQTPPGSGTTVGCRTVTAGPTGPLILGTTTSYVGSNYANSPVVGYMPGRTWLGFKEGSAWWIRALDSGSCATCGESATWPSVNGSMSIATAAGSGVLTDELALAAWRNGSQVLAQRLSNHGSGGSYANLGGGCGAGGNANFSHAPAIGSSSLACNLNSLPPSALLAIFNLAAPGAPVPCGPCMLAPFMVTNTVPVVGGAATITFPIPCLANLVGSQFETQWTTIDFTQAPCPALPVLAFSNRTLMTIGN